MLGHYYYMDCASWWGLLECGDGPWADPDPGVHAYGLLWLLTRWSIRWLGHKVRSIALNIRSTHHTMILAGFQDNVSPDQPRDKITRMHNWEPIMQDSMTPPLTDINIPFSFPSLQLPRRGMQHFVDVWVWVVGTREWSLISSIVSLRTPCFFKMAILSQDNTWQYYTYTHTYIGYSTVELHNKRNSRYIYIPVAENPNTLSSDGPAAWRQWQPSPMQWHVPRGSKQLVVRNFIALPAIVFMRAPNPQATISHILTPAWMPPWEKLTSS